MTEIIETMPWNCGERDCPVGWHQSNYWVQEDGSYTVDNYGDGDHDDIDEDELPSSEEVDESWRQYYADSAETGCDPLDALRVPATRVRRRKWRGEWRRADQFHQTPRKELCDYLMLEPLGAYLVFCDPAGERGNFKDLCKLIDADENCQRQRVRSGLKFIVTVEETDPVVGLDRKIRRAARDAQKSSGEDE